MPLGSPDNPIVMHSQNSMPEATLPKQVQESLSTEKDESMWQVSLEDGPIEIEVKKRVPAVVRA